VIFEHFNFDMQELLEDYQSQKIDFAKLNEEYAKGPEGHDVLAYSPLLEHARSNPDSVKLHAGFIPRTFARTLMREGLEPALEAAKAKDFISADEMCAGSEHHYNFFDSLISGRDMHDTSTPPGENFRRMFPAQIIKDAAMAYKVTKLIKEDAAGHDRYLVICGNGHMGYGYGVPERIYSSIPEIAEQTYMILAREPDHLLSLEKEEPEDFTADLKRCYGETKTPADVCFVFEEWEYDEETNEEEKKEGDEQVKHDTAAAYDKVGETAHHSGNLKKAYKVMKSIDYSDEEIKIAGDDAYNFQGVNNPHNLAKVQEGETVLDLGSGLGVDSFIASHRVGEQGKVIGLDISKKEVMHATKRAAARGVSDRVRFVNADMEKMPLEDNSISCVISNGAFCLAPNKAKAFAEIHRILKPGGRFSIATSTMTADVDQSDGKKWPICMRMFIHQDKLVPICEELGFKDVYLDTSNSEMQFELSDDEEMATNEERTQIHGGSKEFQHLRDYDINSMCARVVIFGRKPEA
jgi:ubiquinone/menaquinone biosynthesis C-methylase UbiE/uncharacterized iron-regulated protein